MNSKNEIQYAICFAIRCNKIKNEKVEEKGQKKEEGGRGEGEKNKPRLVALSEAVNGLVACDWNRLFSFSETD